MAENAEIYDLAAQAMEKLYGGAGDNFATFEKRGRGLMTNMFGDMVNPDWWTKRKSLEIFKKIITFENHLNKFSPKFQCSIWSNWFQSLTAESNEVGRSKIHIQFIEFK